MYAVTNAYKLAKKSNVRKTFITGTITTSANKVINFNDSNIQKGSLYATNQCVNSNELEFGSIFTTECGFTIKCDADRYSLYNAEIVINESSELLDGTLEVVPIGTFYANEVVRNLSKISIVAYDSMLNLDKKIEEETQGDVYELLNLIETKTGVKLAQSQAEIEALPNAKRQFTVKLDRIETYRDLLSSLGQVTATFGLITKENKLKLQPFSKNPVADVDKLQRKTSNISDFETYFNSVKASFIAQENYYPYEVTSDDPDLAGGLQLNIGEVPIVQGTVETKYDIMNELLEELIQIRYTPCEIQIANDSSIELGDMITNNNVNNSNENVNCLITYYKWIYHGLETLKSAGGNPKLNTVKSSTDKAINSAINSIDPNDVVVYSYTNSKNYIIRYSEIEIVKFQFATTGEANPILLANVQFELDSDGYVVFNFYEDNVLREDLTLTKYYERGKHFDLLFMNAKDEAGTRNEITIRASCKYFESDNKIIQNKLNNLTSLIKPVEYTSSYTAELEQTDFELPKNYNENSILNVYVNKVLTDYTINDGYVVLEDVMFEDEVDLVIINLELNDYKPIIEEIVPTMIINEFDIHAVVWSQGISSNEGHWDGTIPVTEAIKDILTMTDFKINGFNTNVSEVIE